MAHNTSEDNRRIRAEQYAQANDIEIIDRLGFGQDGTVFKTNRQSALKVFKREHSFSNELKIYHILSEHEVDDVNGHSVPQLWFYSHSLLIIEMSIVRAPYLLDFAKVTIGARHDFPDDVWEQWLVERKEQFGDRWPEAKDVMDIMALRYDIYLNDINPGNLRF